MKDVQTVIISLWYSSSTKPRVKDVQTVWFSWLFKSNNGRREKWEETGRKCACVWFSLSLFFFFLFLFFFLYVTVCASLWKESARRMGKHDKRYRADTARVCMRKRVCVCGRCTEKIVFPCLVNTAWCSEIGSLTSPMHATQVHPVTTENQFHCTRLYFKF